MAMDKRDQWVFDSHNSVVCFFCEKVIPTEVSVVDTHRRVGMGKYKKKCPVCRLGTYYDLSKDIEIMKGK